MTGDHDDQSTANALKGRILGNLKKLTGRGEINALRLEIMALRAEFEMLPNGPKGRIETLQELCDRLEVRLSEVVELAGQPRASERRDARIISDLERRIQALEQSKGDGS